MDLTSAVASLKSLKPILPQIRNNFAQYESIGKALSGTSLYTSEKRNKLDQVGDWIDSKRLEPRDKLRAQTFYAIIDKLSAELYQRIQKYENLLYAFFIFTEESVKFPAFDKTK